MSDCESRGFLAPSCTGIVGSGPTIPSVSSPPYFLFFSSSSSKPICSALAIIMCLPFFWHIRDIHQAPSIPYPPLSSSFPSSRPYFHTHFTSSLMGPCGVTFCSLYEPKLKIKKSSSDGKNTKALKRIYSFPCFTRNQLSNAHRLCVGLVLLTISLQLDDCCSLSKTPKSKPSTHGGTSMLAALAGHGYVSYNPQRKWCTFLLMPQKASSQSSLPPHLLADFKNWDYPGIYQRFAYMYLTTRAGFNTHVNSLVVWGCEKVNNQLSIDLLKKNLF